jgi:hypothetical protein
VNFPRILNYFCYAAVPLIQIESGRVLSVIAQIFKRFFDRIEYWDICPSWARWAVPYGISPTSTIVSYLLGFGFFGLLCWLEQGDGKRRAYIPLCVTIALTLAWLQILIAFEIILFPMMATSTGGHA